MRVGLHDVAVITEHCTGAVMWRECLVGDGEYVAVICGTAWYEEV